MPDLLPFLSSLIAGLTAWGIAVQVGLPKHVAANDNCPLPRTQPLDPATPPR